MNASGTSDRNLSERTTWTPDGSKVYSLGSETNQVNYMFSQTEVQAKSEITNANRKPRDRTKRSLLVFKDYHGNLCLEEIMWK